MVRRSHHLMCSRDIANQRILDSDWPKSTVGHKHPRVVGVNPSCR